MNHSTARTTARVLTAVLLAALVMVAAPAAEARRDLTRAQQWRAIAVDALAKFKTMDSGAERSNTYAWALETQWRLNGWTVNADDPDGTYAGRLAGKIYAQRKPDGGWGLPFTYDALGDGTVNGVDTTYTVTLAGHVGPVFLAAIQHGMDNVYLPDGTSFSLKTQVRNIVGLLMTTPHIDTAQGMCLAYSRNPNDTRSYGCIHNASAGAARFLADANAAGLGRGGLAALVEGITRREVYAYIVGPITVGTATRTNWWRYMDTTSLNDADHNSYDAESMYFLAPFIGQNSAWMHMNTAFTDNSNAPVAHFRLAALPAAPGRIDAATGLPVWCVLGDRWMTEARAFLAGATDAQRVAQVAQGAARVADNCRAPGEPVTPTVAPTTTSPPTPTSAGTSPSPINSPPTVTGSPAG